MNGEFTAHLELLAKAAEVADDYAVAGVLWGLLAAIETSPLAVGKLAYAIIPVINELQEECAKADAAENN